MATGTLAPNERRQYFDNNGLPLDSGRLYTYAAGTDTPLAVYQDISLLVPHPNPAVLDGAGRITIYLPTGSSYKFVLKDKNNATIWSQDNIQSIPGSTVDLDVSGMAGAPMPDRNPTYLSKDDGKWYYASTQSPAYSSEPYILGMTLAPIATGQRGPIRLQGRITNIPGLIAGNAYYLSATPGQLTSVWARGTRRMGVADVDGQSLVLQPEDRAVTAGVHDLWVSALAFQPRQAGGVPCGNHVHVVQPTLNGEAITLPFSATASQGAFALVRMPTSWDQGAIAFDVHWLNESGGVGNVYWAYYMQRTGANQLVMTSPQWFLSGSHLSAALPAYTIASNPSGFYPNLAGVPPGQFLHFIIHRAGDAPTDTYPNPAHLLGVNLRFRTIANTDD